MGPVGVSSALRRSTHTILAIVAASSSSSLMLSQAAKEAVYREVPAELQISLQSALEWSLNCRPHNAVTYLKVFFDDERDNATKETKALAHALHAIPLVLHREAALRDNACSIFCHYNLVGSSGSSQSALKVSNSFLSIQKGLSGVGGLKVDNRSNLLYNSIYQSMKCSYFQPLPVVDSIMEKISGSASSLNDTILSYSAKFNQLFPVIDTQDFKSFINFLSVPVACHLANEWLKVIFRDYHEYNSQSGSDGSSCGGGNTISSSITLNTPRDSDFLGNKLNLLNYLRKKLTYTSLEEAVNFTTCWNVEDHQKWSSLLFQVLESTTYGSKLSSFQDVHNVFAIEVGVAVIAGFTGTSAEKK